MRIFRSRRADRAARRPPAGAGPATDIGAATHVGRRADNQDRWHVDEHLAVVSDGMGGYRGGALAAQRCVDAVVAALGERTDDSTPERVRGAVASANAAVRVARNRDPEVAEMGATLVIAVPVPVPVRAPAPVAGATDPMRWLVAHVGDSPAFLVTAEATTAVTTDHTPAAELVAAGILTEAEAARHPTRHLLLRAVGPDPVVEADLAEVDLGPGDALVLCSDGLSGTLTADQIATIVRAAASASSAAATLVTTAVDRGAADNVTAVVLRR